MQQPQPIPVFRPSYLTDGAEFQGSLVESPSNIFYQKVNASRATTGRIQFQWRSPSDNLLLSPVVMLRTTLKITCPQLWSQVMAYINVHGVLAPTLANALNGGAGGVDDAFVSAADYGVANWQGLQVPAICMADGDAFTSCASSINFIFNGTSLGLNRTNRYWRDFVRTQISSDDAAKIYKSAGGAFDKKDQRGVAACIANLTYEDDGTVVGHGQRAAKASQRVAGITQDSGIADRCRAFFSLLKDGSGNTNTDTGFSARYLQVSYPVPVAPLNPFRGVAVPASCPYRACPLAIPHLSSGGLDFLMESFVESFIRRLGRTAHGATYSGNTVGGNGSTAAVQVSIEDNSTYLELKYFRLSHTRALKESYRFQVWQAQTFLGPVPPSGANTDGFVQKDFGDAAAAANKYVMQPIGKDIVSSTGAGVKMIAADRAGKEWKVTFDVINLAQIPSYLLISAPKLDECYHLGGERNAEIINCMRNLSHNLSIKNLRIIVNSARGAIDPSADETGFIDAERLWQMTLENTSSDYFKEGGFRAWRDYGCAVLLASPQFAPGLQACDGVAYPVQLQVEMTLQNRAVDVSALGMQGAADASKVHELSADYIRGQAQVTALYTKVVLAVSETSATTNAMSYPLDSSERLFNAAGQMR